jgi:C-terminal processing protease CtpA/Prc
MENLKLTFMRSLYILIGISLFALNSFSQSIPTTETIFNIHKKDKQQFEFSLQKGYTLNAVVEQMGIDLSISVYKKGDTSKLAYFDSPNGEYGPERIVFEEPTGGNYIMIVEALDDDTASSGKYSIRQISIRMIQAKHDTSFANSSEIVLDYLNPLKIDNLTNLGMIWGFLKYYHPAVARGDYNWDASLFRILPKIISAETKEAANMELEKWVDSIGKPDVCSKCSTAKPDSAIQLFPDYGYLFNKGNLNPSLIEKLHFIKDNRNQDENYYVGMAEGIGNPTFEHENPYKNMSYPDAGYRLLSLFRYWNIIQYFYPNKYIIGEDWNKILPEFIPKFVSARDVTGYSLACLEIIARIHDTHANIWGKNSALRDFFGKYEVPVQAKFIENKLVVTGYYSDTLFIKEKLKIGDIITNINGLAVEQLVKNNLYLTPASNYETQLRDMPYRSLLRSRQDSLKLEILRNHKKLSILVYCIEADHVNTSIDFNPNPKDSSYKIINGNIGYIFPGRYHNWQLSTIKKLFENTKGIIIDMRTYPSDFMPFTFGAYIKPKASPFVKFTNGDVNYPGIFRYTPLLSNGEANSEFYRGPIVELVNSVTQSQAEYTTMAFQTSPDLTVIGSITAGADGNISPIYLPGGIYTFISGIGIFYPDGRQTQRKGIKIDVSFSPTIEGIIQGKDELLDKAIEIINSKK